MKTVVTLMLPALAAAFVAPQQGPSSSTALASSRSADKVMSTAIPFIEAPAVLVEETQLAGNFGFDPLGFAKNREQLWEYREAEIKHARLAMLVSGDLVRFDDR